MSAVPTPTQGPTPPPPDESALPAYPAAPDGPEEAHSAAPSRTAPTCDRHGEHGACDVCALDAARDLRLPPPGSRLQVRRPEDAAEAIRPLLAGRDRERCVLLALDRKHRRVALATVSVGTAEHTFMRPREIFRDALLVGASAIVVAHNHPSGDPTPSGDDREVTRRLAEAGQTLGIDLLDHLVVSDGDWVSLARLGVC